LITDTEISFRPLYQHVRERLLARMIDGRWQPGMLLPSEQQLAAELGVSQGTVRKALDALAVENLIVRRQGRGTFVAVPEEGRLLFQLYRLRRDADGAAFVPQSIVHSVKKMRASAEARQRLELGRQGTVWVVERSRTLDGDVLTSEILTLDAQRFPQFDERAPLPNNVYVLYATAFGQVVARVDERLKAVAADGEHAKRLRCAPGTPLLLIDRIAYGLDGSPIEWRRSYSATQAVHYFSELR
jgi:GntR family transcriptional regulator